MPNEPELTIVLGTRDRPQEFARLVRSLCATCTTDLELVISEASEVPYAEQVLRATGLVWHVLREWPPLGAAKGYNHALTAARGEWVVWLNDDCELIDHGWDRAAIDWMRDHRTAGVGCLPFADCPLHGGHGCGEFFHVETYGGMPYPNFGIMRRELGALLGWFNTRLWMYGMDNDLACRVVNFGQAVAEVPGVRIVHWRAWDKNMALNNLTIRQTDSGTFGQLWPLAVVLVLAEKNRRLINP